MNPWAHESRTAFAASRSHVNRAIFSTAELGQLRRWVGTGELNKIRTCDTSDHVCSVVSHVTCHRALQWNSTWTTTLNCYHSTTLIFFITIRLLQHGSVGITSFSAFKISRLQVSIYLLLNWRNVPSPVMLTSHEILWLWQLIIIYSHCRNSSFYYTLFSAAKEITIKHWQLKIERRTI